jgi:hypothetical protein
MNWLQADSPVPHVDRLQALLEERADQPTTDALRIASTEWGYSGSRATFFRSVRSLHPALVPEPMERFAGLAGEFAQFDFGQAQIMDGHFFLPLACERRLV